MKNCKRILSSVLIFCMLISLAPAAFAAEDSTTPVVISGNDTVTVGNVNVTTNGNAVWAAGNATVNVEGEIIQYSADSTSDYNQITLAGVSTSDGNSAAVNVSGSAYGTAPAGNAVYSYAQESESTVNIGGNVDLDLEKPVTSEHGGTGVYSSVHGEYGSSSVTIDGGINVSGETQNATGVSASVCADYTGWDSETMTAVDIDNASTTATNTVSVGGDIAVGAEQGSMGINARTEEGGTVTVTVDGGITASPLPSEDWSDATGVNVGVSKDAGTVDVTVGGDILLPGEANTACGVSSYVEASYWVWNEETGQSELVKVDSTTGSSNVTVDGNITVFASDSAYGINETAAEGGTANVTVGGNIYAEGNGESYSSATGAYTFACDDAKADVSIGGDVSAVVGDHADGINVNARNGGSTDVEVGGSVSVEADTENAYYKSSGVSATVSGDSGSASVTVDGDVSVSGLPGSADGVYASAYGSYWEWDQEAMESHYVDIPSSTGSVSVTVGGDVTVSASRDADGVSADSGDGTSSEVLVKGGVSVNAGTGMESHAKGVDAMSYNNGNTSVSIGDDVSVSLSSESGSAFGATVNASNEGATEVLIDGDLSVDSLSYAFGMSVNSFFDASADVTVNGDISVAGAVANGVDMAAFSSAQADATLNGDVKVSGENSATALQVSSYSDSNATLLVNGSVSAESSSEGASTGLAVNAASDGAIDVTVNGDITADTALFIHTATPSDVLPKHVNVTVDGTISGNKNSIVFDGDADSVTLTVWKVDLDEDGHAVSSVVSNAENNPSLTEEELSEMNAKSAEIAEQVEQNILYIVRLEQPTEGGTLSLSGTTKSEGFDVAKEGDNVVLYIAVADGYQVDGAYNGDGAKVELQKDSDGNYFLVVPRGGGVCLSAVMSLIPVIEAIVPPEAPVTKQAAVKKAIAKAETTVSAGEASEEAAAEEPIAVAVKDENGNAVDAKIKVVFYSDGTFEIVITIDGAQTKIVGTFKFVGDVLTLVLKDGTEIAMNEDGLLIVPLPNGRTIEIKLDQATIDTLKKAAK